MMLFTKYRYQDLSPEQRNKVFKDLLLQCKGIDWINRLFIQCWEHWKQNDWYFDGATFVNEHNGNFWEVAAFIHDALNKMGYVGKGADLVIIKIMHLLEYDDALILERYKFFKWTFINTWKHKLKGTFVSSELPMSLLKPN